MEDLATHILDIVENSAKAGAGRVRIAVEEDRRTDLLRITVEDDGPGMAAEDVRRAADPFFTTRTTRRVGLGLPLLKDSAREAGGDLTIESAPGEGTRVVASMSAGHIDCRPLGNLTECLLALVTGFPQLQIVFERRLGDRSFVFDTADVRRELDGLPASHPAVLGFLREYLSGGLADLADPPRDGRRSQDGETADGR